MEKFLRRIADSGERGLYICQLPTGYGKSYAVSKVIADLAKADDKRKIIYLTTLKKNLPENDIRSFMDDMELYDKTVLRIRSNIDEVREKIGQIIFPDEFKSDKYSALKKALYDLDKAEKAHIRDRDYLEELNRRASDAERIFRYEITDMLRKRFISKAQRLDAVKTDKRYKWIGELYPAVFTDERRILLMTVSKFLGKNSTIVEPSYDFITSPMIDNAVIFIDEFDASKSWVLDHFIDRSLSTESEYITLFRQIYRHLDMELFSEDLQESIRTTEKAGSERFETLIRKGSSIIEKYHLELNYKTAEKEIDRKRNFLFHDGSFHTVFDGNKHYIRAHKNDKTNRVDIYLETKECFYKNKSSSDVQVYGMLRDIHSYFSYFAMSEQYENNFIRKVRIYAIYPPAARSPAQCVFERGFSCFICN